MFKINRQIYFFFLDYKILFIKLNKINFFKKKENEDSLKPASHEAGGLML